MFASPKIFDCDCRSKRRKGTKIATINKKKDKKKSEFGSIDLTLWPPVRIDEKIAARKSEKFYFAPGKQYILEELDGSNRCPRAEVSIDGKRTDP